MTVQRSPRWVINNFLKCSLKKKKKNNWNRFDQHHHRDYCIYREIHHEITSSLVEEINWWKADQFYIPYLFGKLVDVDHGDDDDDDNEHENDADDGGHHGVVRANHLLHNCSPTQCNPTCWVVTINSLWLFRGFTIKADLHGKIRLAWDDMIRSYLHGRKNSQPHAQILFCTPFTKTQPNTLLYQLWSIHVIYSKKSFNLIIFISNETTGSSLAFGAH